MGSSPGSPHARRTRSRREQRSAHSGPKPARRRPGGPRSPQPGRLCAIRRCPGCPAGWPALSVRGGPCRITRGRGWVIRRMRVAPWFRSRRSFLPGSARSRPGSVGTAGAYQTQRGPPLSVAKNDDGRAWWCAVVGRRHIGRTRVAAVALTVFSFDRVQGSTAVSQLEKRTDERTPTRTDPAAHQAAGQSPPAYRLAARLGNFSACLTYFERVAVVGASASLSA